MSFIKHPPIFQPSQTFLANHQVEQFAVACNSETVVTQAKNQLTIHTPGRDDFIINFAGAAIINLVLNFSGNILFISVLRSGFKADLEIWQFSDDSGGNWAQSELLPNAIPLGKMSFDETNKILTVGTRGGGTAEFPVFIDFSAIPEPKITELTGLPSTFEQPVEIITSRSLTAIVTRNYIFVIDTFTLIHGAKMETVPGVFSRAKLPIAQKNWLQLYDENLLNSERAIFQPRSPGAIFTTATISVSENKIAVSEVDPFGKFWLRIYDLKSALSNTISPLILPVPMFETLISSVTKLQFATFSNFEKSGELLAVLTGGVIQIYIIANASSSTRSLPAVTLGTTNTWNNWLTPPRLIERTVPGTADAQLSQTLSERNSITNFYFVNNRTILFLTSSGNVDFRKSQYLASSALTVSSTTAPPPAQNLFSHLQYFAPPPRFLTQILRGGRR